MLSINKFEMVCDVTAASGAWSVTSIYCADGRGWFTTICYHEIKVFAHSFASYAQVRTFACEFAQTVGDGETRHCDYLHGTIEMRSQGFSSYEIEHAPERRIELNPIEAGNLAAVLLLLPESL